MWSDQPSALMLILWPSHHGGIRNEWEKHLDYNCDEHGDSNLRREVSRRRKNLFQMLKVIVGTHSTVEYGDDAENLSCAFYTKTSFVCQVKLLQEMTQLQQIDSPHQNDCSLIFNGQLQNMPSFITQADCCRQNTNCIQFSSKQFSFYTLNP